MLLPIRAQVPVSYTHLDVYKRQALIWEENVGKMELLESFGWFGAEELENFICTARRERKLESLVWLMRLKDQKYGYKEKKFDL